jgi:hypothetical protein
MLTVCTDGPALAWAWHISKRIGASWSHQVVSDLTCALIRLIACSNGVNISAIFFSFWFLYPPALIIKNLQPIAASLKTLARRFLFFLQNGIGAIIFEILFLNGCHDVQLLLMLIRDVY